MSAAVDRKILHVDMDAFYASIEQRDRPELRGKPVIVGSPPDQRGVVSAASYEARTFGVHSAMPSRTAGRLCPHGVFVPVNMRHYQHVSEQLMMILHHYTPDVEQLSVDEAFLDVTSVMRMWGGAVELARSLKDRIHKDLGLTASVGVAPNKFLAKLSSDIDKPDGLTLVPMREDEIIAFLAPMPIRAIWGVGKKTAEHLAQHGITRVEHVQQLTRQQCRGVMGESMGDHIWSLAHGWDDREVDGAWEEKSISHEYTFDVDCEDVKAVRQKLLEQTEKVGRRLRQAGKLARTGYIKVRFEDFRTITRQRSLGAPTCSDRQLLQVALELFDRENIERPLRLIGFGVSDLVAPASPEALYQATLFEDRIGALPVEKETELDRAVDRVRTTYGVAAIRRGAWNQEEQDEK